MKEGAAGVSKKSHAGDNRGIPPFKKTKGGHPALMSTGFWVAAPSARFDLALWFSPDFLFGLALIQL